MQGSDVRNGTLGGDLVCGVVIKCRRRAIIEKSIF